MSLKDIRSECSDVAGFLQPYVDGELNDDEQEPVAAHLESCSGCRAAVTEQAWVRSTLQAMEREPAPQALRAKILLGLDEVDREAAAEAAASAPPGFGARLWARVRDLGRGGLIMVPASAVAVGLFVMAQQGAFSPEQTAAPAAPGYGLGSAILPGAEAGLPTSEDDLSRTIAELEPEVGFRVQMPRADRGPGMGDLQLVSVGLEREAAEVPAARLRYLLPGGQHVVDRQVPSGAYAPRGNAYDVSGRSYHLHHDDAGQPVLWFRQGGVAHMLVLEGAEVGPQDRAAADPSRPHYDLLLKFAAHLGDR